MFLDLEDTVITPAVNGWERTECINIEKVKNVIREFKPDFIHLFSFAIWNERELNKFKVSTLGMIQKVFGIEFHQMWTVDDDIIPMCSNELGLTKGIITFADASDFWSKHQSFRLCMRQHFKGNPQSAPVQVMLLDDVVFNEVFEWPDMGLTGFVRNIDQIK